MSALAIFRSSRPHVAQTFELSAPPETGRKTRSSLSGIFVGIQECQRESSLGVDNEFRGESALINEKHSMHTNEDSLNRGLRERHIRLMALGSTIGVGLFLGSASAIKLAGPAILLSSVLGGIAIFIIMRALGKVAAISRLRAPLAAMRKTILVPCRVI